MADLEAEIRVWLARYARGEIALSEFDAWFTPATWETDDSALVNEIRLLLAESTSEGWTDSELRQRLSALVGAAKVVAAGTVNAGASVSLSLTAMHAQRTSSSWSSEADPLWRVSSTEPQTSAQTDPAATAP